MDAVAQPTLSSDQRAEEPGMHRKISGGAADGPTTRLSCPAWQPAMCCLLKTCMGLEFAI